MDDILVTGYNESGADHDAAVHKVIQQCEKVNLKLNKEKFHFRWTSILFFGGLYLDKEVNQTHKNQSPDRHANNKQQKGTADFSRYY